MGSNFFPDATSKRRELRFGHLQTLRRGVIVDAHGDEPHCRSFMAEKLLASAQQLRVDADNLIVQNQTEILMQLKPGTVLPPRRRDCIKSQQGTA